MCIACEVFRFTMSVILQYDKYNDTARMGPVISLAITAVVSVCMCAQWTTR